MKGPAGAYASGGTGGIDGFPVQSVLPIQPILPSRGVVSGFSRTRHQQLLDAVENLRRYARLRLQRERLRAARADDGHGVGVDVEAGVVPRHVVGDNEVGVL